MPCSADQSATRQPAALTRQDLAEKLRVYAAISKLEVRFRQIKKLKEMGIQLQSEGRMELVRPSRVKWEISKPSPVLVTMDDEKIQIEVGSGPEMRRQTLRRGQVTSDQVQKNLSELVAWLSMDAAELDRHYQAFVEGKNLVRFDPREKGASAFRSLRMELSDENHLKRLWLEELSGDSIEIEFDKPRISKASGISGGAPGARGL